MTRLARERMLDDEARAAFNFVARSLVGGPPGAADHAARQVLDGLMRLEGDSDREGLCLVVDETPDAAEYRRRLRWLYAGRVRVDRIWYQPRSRVDDLGPDDADWADRRGGYSSALYSESFQRWARKREEFYAQPDGIVCIVRTNVARPKISNDLPVKERAPAGKKIDGWFSYCRAEAGERDAVVFDRTSEPPHWWDEPKTPQKAYEEWAAAGHVLASDGWTVRFPGAKMCRYLPDEKAVQKAPREDAEARAEEARKQIEIERAEQAQREADFELQVADIRRRVLEQAAGDTFPLTLKDGTVIEVPRAPFEQWALGNTALASLAAPWTPVSPEGLKMGQADDPYHSDWVVGAGLKPRGPGWGMQSGEAYSENVSGPSYDAKFELQRRKGSFQVSVVNDAGDVFGTVGKEIVVIPDLSPERLPEIAGARGIITERGGALAHLAVVGRENGITIMRDPDATKKYVEGTGVTLMPSEGKIRVQALRKVQW